MTAPFGWTGVVLHIDLDTGKITRQRPDPSVYRAFVGGRGLAGHYLSPHADRETTDPALPLLFFAGPLTGTLAPTSGRISVMSRSPLTGTVCDEPAGGKLGTQLKRAGYDGLVITGRSETPCGIDISDDTVRVTPTDLWGLPTDAVFDQLDGAAGADAAKACVGPAAENGSPLGAILIDRRHGAMRGGLGLIMARKNLKYLTVRGTKEVPVHDSAFLLQVREEIIRQTAASPVLLGPHGFSRRGTGALFDLIHSRRMMPTDNFTATRFQDAPACNVAAFAKRFAPRDHACSGCHIGCKKIAADGRSMPEYEVMAHITALMGNADLDLVMEASTLCGSLGLDPVSAAATLACLREVDGHDYPPQEVYNRLREMADGGDLGRGAHHLAETLGRPETAITVKGLELPAYDPRGAMGMALAYAVSTRGGCPSRATPITHEILRKPVATDRFTFSGKARIIKIAEDINAAVDSLTACRFTFFAAGLEEYAKAFTAVTGVEMDGFALQEIGERICCNERLMNTANGFDVSDDDLPERFFTEPGSSGGGVDIAPIDRKEFLAARNRYYAVRGLDENGHPTDATLQRLELN